MRLGRIFFSAAAAAAPRRSSGHLSVGRQFSRFQPFSSTGRVGDDATATWHSTGLAADVLRGVTCKFGFQAPTDIQSRTIPLMLQNGEAGENQHIIYSSETGSGKTLAFLLPLIHRLRFDEAASRKEPKAARPRAVILVPNRELGLQILDVAKLLARDAPVRSAFITGGPPGHGVMKEKYLKTQILDIIIATPQKLLDLRNDGKIFLGKVKYVVADEADVLTNPSDGFAGAMDKLFEGLLESRVDEPSPKMCFAGATLLEGKRDHAVRWIKKIVPESDKLRFVRGRNSHAFPEGLEYSTVRSDSYDKFPALRSLLRYSLEKNPSARSVIVFCNSKNSVRAVEHDIFNNIESIIPTDGAIESAAVVRCLHGDMPPQRRRKAYKEFCEAENSSRILVATDIAARGLDFNAGVDEVVMFEPPSSFLDFIHRMGRTARAGNKGRVTILVSKHGGEGRFYRKFKEAQARRTALGKRATDEFTFYDGDDGDDGELVKRSPRPRRRKIKSIRRQRMKMKKKSRRR